MALNPILHADQRYALGINAVMWRRDPLSSDWKPTGAGWHVPADMRPGADVGRERVVGELLAETILANRTPSARIVLEPLGTALAVAEAASKAAGA